MSRSAEGNGDLDTLKDLQRDGASDLHTWLALPLPNLQHMEVGKDGGEGRREVHGVVLCPLHPSQ